MNKTKLHYVCDRCGEVFPQWYGFCPACRAQGTLGEVRQSLAAPAAAARRVGVHTAVPVNKVKRAEVERMLTGTEELDRVLGGGLVPGALILLAGDPGLGKSTLLLQAANSFAARNGSRHGPCLYVSGEESLHQVAMRSDRLGPISDDLLLMAESDVEVIEQQVEEAKPGLLVIDSVQAMYAPSVESLPGSVSQIRDCALRMMRIAKDKAIPTFLVGHVTKIGSIAGPRVLEHMVDTVLQLEGDRFSGYRILRGVKNRFGSTDEVGMFRMVEHGMEGVPDASAELLRERVHDAPGSAVAASLEGSRPLLVEVQALVSRASATGPARRSVNGLDYNRTCMVMAVLDKRTPVQIGDKDVFINVPGGLRLDEPATDLALALAMASSFQDMPLPDDMAFLGEVGLTGEVRSIPGLDLRLTELARRGFRRCLVPKRSGKRTDLELIPVHNVGEALEAALPTHPRRKR